MLQHTGWRKFSLEKQKESFAATKTAGRSLNVSLEILYFISKKTARKCPDMLLKVPSLVATITLLHQQKDVWKQSQRRVEKQVLSPKTSFVSFLCEETKGNDLEVAGYYLV